MFRFRIMQTAFMIVNQQLFRSVKTRVIKHKVAKNNPNNFHRLVHFNDAN